MSTEKKLTGEGMNAEDDVAEAAAALILRNLNAFHDSMLLRCAMDLNLPDIIQRLSTTTGGHGVVLSELADALPRQPVNANHLRRILSYLVHMGILSHHEERYGLTQASELLLVSSDASGEKNAKNLRPFILMMSDPSIVSAWNGISDAPYTDTTVFEARHKTNLWGLMGRRPELSALFNEAMRASTCLWMPAIVRAIGTALDGARSLVDVGGGTGATAACIAKAFPKITCTVLDLPHVVRDAAAQLEEGVKVVGGDMFDHVPPADAVMLKRILHDWSDGECIKILRRCKGAIPRETGVVIIVEVVMEDEDVEDNFREWKLSMDIAMMTTTGGKERSRKEWNSILNDAGFDMHRITHALLGESVIEARPRWQ